MRTQRVPPHEGRGSDRGAGFRVPSRGPSRPPMHRLLLALVLLVSAPLAAQPAASEVDTPRPLVVMNLAAHPDDEDGLTLAYYRGNRDAVAYSVIYTRGDGGQNEAGPELYERLGAIRSRETEAAGRTLGTQVFFLNHYDFGFSKHAREAFAEWGVPQQSFWEPRPSELDAEAGRDLVTARLVYLYRALKPDVVFTNHDTVTVGANRQHGHHQAVGVSAYDAFALAADPTYHPEQLADEGVDLWQPKRLFLRR
ncbi:MAG TPA: PIG-L family deacetylase, partial [Rhodothermales bacterium]|nr:PIG-L family deacetylase [Rhodothermales bacterium]